ncbi:MAG: aminopeptidase P family protein [Cryobacterium sp.]
MADSTNTAPAPAPAARTNENRSTTPGSEGFKEYISSGWAERSEELPPAREQAPFAAARRERISQLYSGHRLIVPAGRLKQRANDTDYAFRAHSAFAHLTGWGSDSEPGAVLVFEPTATGHDVTVYFRERAGRDSDEFYANSEIGEFWIGPRPSIAQVASDLALPVRGIDDFAEVLRRVDSETLLVREADPFLTGQVDDARLRNAAEKMLTANATDAPFSVEINGDHDADATFVRDLSELRLVKDAYEIGQMRLAVAATARGFEDVIRDLPRSSTHERGERLVEGVFNTRARADGNTVGYDTIAASGPHACILHWTRNDGPVLPGDVMLLDAGIEVDSYYTADITRTLPIDGTFSEVQRRVYDAVREAADAAFLVARPGAIFRDVHAAAMAVIARHTAAWGMLPVTAEEALKPENGQHRRYMVHGTSHHLGLDVHDCAQARRDMYMDGVIEPGMVFTIEPGLYFQPDDLTVPAEYRGIGVRIEDDILITETGAENLSAGIPRESAAVEAWMAALRG